MKKRREKKTWLIDIRKYDRIFFLNVINIEIIKLMEIYSIFLGLIYINGVII